MSRSRRIGKRDFTFPEVVETVKALVDNGASINDFHAVRSSDANAVRVVLTMRMCQMDGYESVDRNIFSFMTAELATWALVCWVYIDEGQAALYIAKSHLWTAPIALTAAPETPEQFIGKFIAEQHTILRARPLFGSANPGGRGNL